MHKKFLTKKKRYAIFSSFVFEENHFSHTFYEVFGKIFAWESCCRERYFRKKFGELYVIHFDSK